MSRSRNLLLYLMVVLYIGAGICHLVYPSFFLAIMPPSVPFPDVMVALSGILEILFGSMLLIPVTRAWAAWLIILLLIAVFPANIQMAMNYYLDHRPGFWITILRLPFQPLLIWWAWQYTREKQGTVASSRSSVS